MVDFSKYQKQNDTSPEDQDQEITPGENDQKVAIHSKKKDSKKSTLLHSAVQNSFVDSKKIDHKINELLNERLLKLVDLGLQHELTIENMIHYFKQVNKSKLYELRRYFSDSSSYEIDRMLKYLYSTGVIKRDKNNWYSLK